MSLSGHFSHHRTAGLRLAAALAAGVTAIGAAAAQPAGPRASPTVTVDWGALDALGTTPAQPALAPVTLHAPPKRQLVAVPPPAAPGVQVPQAKPAVSVPAPSPPPVAAVSKPAAPALASAPATSAPALAPGRPSMIQFAAGRSDIPPEGQDVLNSIAAQLAGNPKLRLQLVAYASGPSDDAVVSRRLSLARAVQMRSYLIEKGVQSVRMDVRALGNRTEGGGPADRVDLVILDR